MENAACPVMTFEDFSNSLQPSGEWSKPLLALWEAKQGRWDKAHAIVQNLSSPDAAWVHAWLHRQEGDESNAGYWYHRAGREPQSGSLEKEWEDIATELISV